MHFFFTSNLARITAAKQQNLPSIYQEKNNKTFSEKDVFTMNNENHIYNILYTCHDEFSCWKLIKLEMSWEVMQTRADITLAQERDRLPGNENGCFILKS